MSGNRGALYANKTESTLIKSGEGRVFGVVANSHSSGTIALTDGTQTGSVEASGVLTSSGASAPADYATATLTSDGTNFVGFTESQGTITISGTPVADETMVMGGTTYTFKATRALTGEITIDADNDVLVNNIVTAITADSTDTTAVDGAGSTVVVTAVVQGTAGDSVVFTEAATGVAVDGAGTLGTTTAGVDAETITINTTVYRMMTTTEAAYDVKIGASAAASLDNLKLAINASGTGDGTDYHVGTLVNADVSATTNTDTTQIIRAKLIGTAPNSYATTETAAHAAWGAGTMGSGVATTNATILIGSTTYTMVLTLPESLGYTAVPYYVLWVTNEATFLDNLKLAINQSGTPGTNYSAGTEQHPLVEATTNTATAQTVVAKSAGSSGNSIATTETVANYAWGATTLENGAGSTSRKMITTYTFASGSGGLYFPDPIAFNNGLFATIGGTLDYTVIYR